MSATYALINGNAVDALYVLADNLTPAAFLSERKMTGRLVRVPATTQGVSAGWSYDGATFTPPPAPPEPEPTEPAPDPIAVLQAQVDELTDLIMEML